ncbi:hypothetical protein CL616_02185 [archaeon]|nr:hypothetical protein [archaeon]|tara:strand:+ start:1413 stop:1925 length:513 start_codon:yes stop_codon:yes gene_type:complete
MSQKDYVGTDQTIRKTLIYNQTDLYKYFLKWFEQRHYDTIETEYDEKILATGEKKINWRWIPEKKVEYYVKIIIDFRFEAKTKDVMVETSKGTKKKLQEGTVEGKFRAYIDRDVEDDWQLNKEHPTKRLLREMYDKLISKKKMSKYEDELKQDMKNIMDDFRNYVKTHKY